MKKMTEGKTHSHKINKTKHLGKVLYLLMVLVGLTSISCHKRSFEGMLLIVQETSGENGASSALALVEPERPEQDPVVLVDEFYKIGSPELSYLGDVVLFQAKKNPGDFWQIWEYNLESEALKQLTFADSDCQDPTCLPDGKIVYSRFVANYSGYHVLETCDPQDSSIQQITFGPVDFTAATVLMDGRILAVAKEVHPNPKKEQLMVMRPDGTKIELFYESEKDKVIASGKGVFETSDGRIVFSEKEQGSLAGAQWISVDYNRPMQSRTPFEVESESQIKPLVNVARPLPKKLPSAVKPETETALLVCMDANLSENPEQEIQRKSVQVELLGLQGSLGTVDLEKDGSVYLKIQADMPFRMQTLDSEGTVVQGPSSWLQMRPNERRGCVGCHAGHTRVPENRQPLAVQKEPVEIPPYRETIMASRLIKDDKK